MKKIILGIAIAALTLVPATVYAYEVHLRDTVNIYTVARQEDNKITVSTFDDQGNKCYIVRNGAAGINGSEQANISCVRVED